MCTCDMFPHESPHPDGHIVGDTYCEMWLTPGPRISPHLFPGSVPTEPGAENE